MLVQGTIAICRLPSTRFASLLVVDRSRREWWQLNTCSGRRRSRVCLGRASAISISLACFCSILALVVVLDVGGRRDSDTETTSQHPSSVDSWTRISRGKLVETIHILCILQAAAAGRKRESGAQSPAGAFPLLWLGLGDGCKPRKTAESGISRNSRRGWGNPCASWSAFPPFLATTKAIPCHPCSPDERSEIPLKRDNKVDRETFRSCQRSASTVPGRSDSTRWLQFDRRPVILMYA